MCFCLKHQNGLFANNASNENTFVAPKHAPARSSMLENRTISYMPSSIYLECPCVMTDLPALISAWLWKFHFKGPVQSSETSYIGCSPPSTMITLHKELSPATSLFGYAILTVEAHAAVVDGESLSRIVNPHEVQAAVTSIQLFTRGDSQDVMKAIRWMSRGTFTSFHLRNLCPQTDVLNKLGSVVAICSL